MTRFLISLVLVLFACDGDKPDTDSDTGEAPLGPLEPGFEADLRDWELDIWRDDGGIVEWKAYARASSVQLVVGMSWPDDSTLPGEFVYDDEGFGVLVRRARGIEDCNLGCGDDGCDITSYDRYVSSGGTLRVSASDDEADIQIRDVVFEPYAYEGEPSFEADPVPLDALDVTGVPVVRCMVADCTL